LARQISGREGSDKPRENPARPGAICFLREKVAGFLQVTETIEPNKAPVDRSFGRGNLLNVFAIALAFAVAQVRCAASKQPDGSKNTAPATTLDVPEPAPEKTPEEPAPESDAAPRSRIVELSGGVRIEDLKVGSGAAVEPNHRIRVHYVGTLTDGSVFDSSRGRNQPFEVQLGKGYLIKGFEQGMLGMRVGGIRRVEIPPELGYGSQAHAQIPANSTLIFEIELLGVE
jgi:FKBP-type peptidyl-prolyl cis-trans isomerase